MATFRQIHTKIWKDTWFIELEPEEKMLFIYLFTNEMSSISGIYELPMRVMIFETGLDKGTIQRALDRFNKDGKVFYDSGVVWVTNLRKYHETASPKVKSRIDSDVAAVPDGELKQRYGIAYGYRIHTPSVTENRVGIPPYIYSIVSSNSLNGIEGSESSEAVEYENEIKRIAALVSTVVKTYYGNGSNETEFEQAALSLIGWGATDEQITTGFSEWWAENGNYKGLPALKSYIQEFRNYLRGIATSKKDSPAPEDPAVWKLVTEAVSTGNYKGLSPEQFAAVKKVGPSEIKARNDFTANKVRAEFFRALQGAKC